VRPISRAGDTVTRSERAPRLILRFAAGSLVAFLLVGVGVGALVVHYVRGRVERIGTFHAQFVARAVLAPAFRGVDLSAPVTGSERARLDALLAERLFSDGRDVRIKIWRPDGLIVYSDEPALIGRSFPEEVPDLREALEGRVVAGISDLSEPENRFERNLGSKLFFTYEPFRLTPGGPIAAIAEIYQNYAWIQGDIDGLFHSLLLPFGVGVLVLYAMLLPIALRASRELRRQNTRLNQLLALEQQTVAELRDLNRRKDDFVAAASHELRTPLTSIIGYVSTLKGDLGADPETRVEFATAAEAQAKRLMRQITNLLSAASLQQGSRPIVMERVDFDQLARQVAAQLSRRPERVQVRVPNDVAVVVTDRGRVEEILTNVLDNALKYSPDDTVVEIGASGGEGSFRFWVRDRGIGIDPADREAIFERFHQTDQSSTRRYGGVGLGLFLARGLVQDLGGSIGVESAPGRGSTFTVTIPVVAAPAGGPVSEETVREAVSRNLPV